MFKKSIRRRRIGTNNGMFKLVVCQGGLSRETELIRFAASLLKPETCSVEPLPAQPYTRYRAAR